MPTPDGGAWLVVGLGNPGPGYARNRHNAGFLVVEELGVRGGASFKGHRRGRSDVADIRVGGHQVLLAKPRSYMNDSGGPVSALMDFYKVPIDRLVVVHDELDLEFGQLRLKRGGGDNGHNGLRSLRRSLGGGEFYRVRFGIGRPPGRMDPAEYVLRDFSAPERAELPVNVDRAADAVDALIGSGLDRAQTEFNT